MNKKAVLTAVLLAFATPAWAQWVPPPASAKPQAVAQAQPPQAKQAGIRNEADLKDAAVALSDLKEKIEQSEATIKQCHDRGKLIVERIQERMPEMPNPTETGEAVLRIGMSASATGNACKLLMDYWPSYIAIMDGYGRDLKEYHDLTASVVAFCNKKADECKAKGTPLGDRAAKNMRNLSTIHLEFERIVSARMKLVAEQRVSVKATLDDIKFIAAHMKDVEHVCATTLKLSKEEEQEAFKKLGDVITEGFAKVHEDLSVLATTLETSAKKLPKEAEAKK